METNFESFFEEVSAKYPFLMQSDNENIKSICELFYIKGGADSLSKSLESLSKLK